ncbi:hypothetical protein [Halococcoides cellulosivorans]|uniref:Uncharacterized protein n=1 Tax=Halococcoides cellulosivorans TaxID=1679096 RepID=A0A2R4X0P1_9EURY|nr:hypothetical protein [Halococcoides cellulosivorans]AWB27346.1 hypothetical protein HARCEL1_06345 [Halococcoides cellulosivorans]
MTLRMRGLVVALYLAILGLATLVDGMTDVVVAFGDATTLSIVGAVGTTAVGTALASVAMALYFEQRWARILALVVLVVLVALNAYTIAVGTGFDRWFAAGQVLPNLVVFAYLTLRDPLTREKRVESSESATRIGTTLK